MCAHHTGSPVAKHAHGPLGISPSNRACVTFDSVEEILGILSAILNLLAKRGNVAMLQLLGGAGCGLGGDACPSGAALSFSAAKSASSSGGETRIILHYRKPDRKLET